MPLYEYHCLKCGRNTEKIETYKGPHLAKCPHCGGKVEQLISAPAIQFKGTGWYVTDYGKKTSGGDSSKSDKTERADKSEKTEKSDNSGNTEKAAKPEKSESKPASAVKESKKPASTSKEK